MRDLLPRMGLWRLIEGGASAAPKPPIPPFDASTASTTANTGADTSTPAIQVPDMETWDMQPQSNDREYLSRYYRFLDSWEKYQERLLKAYGTIRGSMHLFIHQNFPSKP